MVEVQAPERVASPVVVGTSIATIESLRARLLSERAASKEARQHAHKIALKVSDLQNRLDAEIEYRKKAEVAMKEVLEVLMAKGVAMEEVMTAVPSFPGSSESEEAAQVSSSKDGESEHSSGEEASQAYMRNCEGSVIEETQILSANSLSKDNFEVEKEGVTSDKGSLRCDSSEGEKEGVTKDEEINSQEQGLSTDFLEEPPQALLDEVGEESNIDQTPEMLCDLAKHLEGVSALSDCKVDIRTANSSPSQLFEPAATPYPELESNMAGDQLSDAPTKEALSSHVGDVNKSKGLLLDRNVQPVAEISYGLGDKGAHGNEGLHLVNDKMASGLTPRDMALPVSTPEFCRKDVHPALFPRGGAYPYELPYMNVDPLQHMHYVPSSEAPFSRGPMSLAYPGREHLNSDVVEFGKHPQAPVSDAILSLVDDKNGKLGSILMALNLAKQQINHEDYASSYMDEIYAALPSPFFGNPYPGLYEGVPHQPPYHPWRSDLQNQAPIVHLPMSPTSDHEASAFERHDGLRRSSSTSTNHMPSYDPYLQPKGELHLGNGITLYTD